MPRTRAIFERVFALPWSTRLNNIDSVSNPLSTLSNAGVVDDKSVKSKLPLSESTSSSQTQQTPPINAIDSVLINHSKSSSTSERLELQFVAVESGLDATLLNARINREQSSLASFTSIKDSPARYWTSMKTLRRWLFTEHKAYASSRLTAKDVNVIDSAVLLSY